MSNSVILTGIIIILFAGVLAIPISKMIFKNSIVHKVLLFLIFPIDMIAILAFIVGARGVIHLSWAAPIALILLFFAYYFVARMLQNPLNEMRTKVLSLAEGDVNISFDQKYRKGENEMSQTMRILVKLSDALKNIAKFADNVGNGKLDTEYALLGDNDSLGKSMLNMRANLQRAESEKVVRAKEEEQRNWGTAGLAKFSEILRRDNDNMETLSYNVISNLVKYLGANQG